LIGKESKGEEEGVPCRKVGGTEEDGGKGMESLCLGKRN